MKKTLAIIVGIVLAGVGTTAYASRNNSGTYTLPSGNPVATGQTISSSWANTTLSDLKNEMTASLSRDGKGGMRQPLACSDLGLPATPDLYFGTDANTGFYHPGPDDLAVAVNGVKVQEWKATGVQPFTMIGPLNVTGAVIATSASLTTLAAGTTTLGNTDTSGLTATALTVTGAAAAQSVTTGTLTVQNSVASSGGIKHGRAGTGSITNGTTASVTVTWAPAPFADANYTVVCVVENGLATAALRVDHIASLTAANFVAIVVNAAGSNQSGNLHCIGMHD